jgi:DNA-binding NarL/FixJ family response regulator
MYVIMIIEDDAELCGNMELILQMEGFETCTAPDGEAAMTRIREKRPDLILCDIMMPGLDGHAVLETLRGDKQYADIPFVFVTALDDRVAIRRGMSVGADDYLTKPFSAEELIACVTARQQRIALFQHREETSSFQKEAAVLQKQITARELEILVLVGQGYTSKQIATQLGIRHNTVEVHRANLMRKLDSPNAANLARWALIAEQISVT